MNKKKNVTNKPQSDIKKRRLRYAIVISAVAIVVSVVMIVGSAFSWFVNPTYNKSNSTVNATDFTATMYVSHNSGSSYEVLNTNGTVANNRVYVVGNTGAHATDIDKKKLKINYTGDSSAYLKVTLYESWYYGSSTSSFAPIPDCRVDYTLAKYNNEDFWVFNEDDGCYYSKKPVSAYSNVTGSAAKGIDIPFVDKMVADSSIGFSRYTYFDLVAIIETVQPDRFDEFFGTSYEDVFGE